MDNDFHESTRIYRLFDGLSVDGLDNTLDDDLVEKLAAATVAAVA